VEQVAKTSKLTSENLSNWNVKQSSLLQVLNKLLNLSLGHRYFKCLFFFALSVESNNDDYWMGLNVVA